MNKEPWMYDIEKQNGWRDLWEGAWLLKNGLWRRIETLADIWDWSDKVCACCGENLLYTPGKAYLVCRWTSELTEIVPNTEYRTKGVSMLPCLMCYGLRVVETRVTVDNLTTITKACRCGLVYTDTREMNALDFVPVGYRWGYWAERSAYQQINDRLKKIEDLLLKG